MNAIEVQNLQRIYRARIGVIKRSVKEVVAVEDISFDIKSGELFGLLGPNGAGKTTTFNMVVGVVRPDEGEVHFEGDEISRLPMHKRARRGMGYLTQEPSVFRKLTVEQNILAILETCKMGRQERRIRLKSLLDELELGGLAKSLAYTLSGGEKRRLEITRALVTSPRLLLLDEPFAGIDPLAINDIQQIIKQLKDRGLGIIISDHNVRETLNVCDKAYIISEGQIIEHGPPEKIVRSEVARNVYLGENFNL